MKQKLGAQNVPAWVVLEVGQPRSLQVLTRSDGRLVWSGYIALGALGTAAPPARVGLFTGNVETWRPGCMHRLDCGSDSLDLLKFRLRNGGKGSTRNCHVTGGDRLDAKGEAESWDAGCI